MAHAVRRIAMSREVEVGMRVRLHTPERGYTYAEIVGFYWPRWVLRLSSGYEFSAYEDEFDLEY
jgi:hypothetical protein